MDRGRARGHYHGAALGASVRALSRVVPHGKGSLWRPRRAGSGGTCVVSVMSVCALSRVVPVATGQPDPPDGAFPRDRLV